ncbi:NERD domain-containing protein [Anaerobacillus sp. CMMVII]|uniref:nuclease-related domain-containing protein n=1 Tax=Anaerobacillus sp. CMMVII TaxID=2755588 RepID=UPI0021B80857|nr:nuclease-related domain-containing protein [Anaerobacillus sp. CMMVII]MCT8140132.1 NERD domain-containing protein [Anaerobacillus sp. CMMVII]
MIIKELKMPLKLEKLIALKRRTPIMLPKYSLIKDETARRLAGYRGECSLHYQLSLLPEKSYYILRGIRLKDGNHFFQIDNLLISQKFFLNLEVKTIAGTLQFDERNHQLIRTLDTKRDGFSDPLTQAYFQEMHLKNWLKQNGYTDLTILSLVVSANPSSILETTSKK